MDRTTILIVCAGRVLEEEVLNFFNSDNTKVKTVNGLDEARVQLSKFKDINYVWADIRLLRDKSGQKLITTLRSNQQTKIPLFFVANIETDKNEVALSPELSELFEKEKIGLLQLIRIWQPD